MIPALFFLFYASLVNDVRALIAKNDLAGAEALVKTYQTRSGATSEVAAATSWLGRGELAAKRYDRADQFATEAFQMGEALLRTRKMDADPWLPTAIGAAIEVHAQASAARGDRADAVAYLRRQLTRFRDTSIAERIGKNINLLSLEGKSAPPLEAAEFFGPKPRSLAALRGHPALLFFWAHWCPDCKALAPVIADLEKKYGPRGLSVVAPTRFYGYVAGGEEATPATERQYIEKIRAQYYAALANVPVPLSAANFVLYGASTTPTLVLVDSAGIVRYYHPGAASEAELSAHIETLLKR